MRYLLLIASDESAESQLTPEESAATLDEYGEWMKAMTDRGLLQGGERLRPVADATTVRVRNGEVLSTDGPFAETKDLIAGWMVIDVDSYQRAIELAGELSAAPGAGGEPIHEWLEVRPFLAAPPTVTP